MTRKISAKRLAKLPDPTRVERMREAPESGPRLLFLSGGTALRDLSRVLKSYTHHSIHLLTPFDSGGSSAALRQAFAMPSVGDLRNRLVALADEGMTGNREIRQLFGTRLPVDKSQEMLAQHLQDIVDGRDILVAAIPSPVQQLVRGHLKLFMEQMPSDFDLRGASLGNLTLTGGYLNHGRNLDAVVGIYSKLLEVRGKVACTLNAHLDLAAKLADGRQLNRQHLLTGKELDPINAQVIDLYLVDRSQDDARTESFINRRIGSEITAADLICYPMGSFYSSLIANLLASGVGRSIARALCPKIYVPNTGHDPEQFGLSVGGAVEKIIYYVAADLDDRDVDVKTVLDLVLIDRDESHYPQGLDLQRINDLGIHVVKLPLVKAGAVDIDPQALTEILLSLA